VGIFPLIFFPFNKKYEILIIQNDGQLIMKKASKLDINLKEDLGFAKKTDEAWNRIEQEKGIKMGFDDFVDEMNNW